MIAHVLLVQARPDLTSREEGELVHAIEGLRSVPGVLDLSWGPDFSGRGRGYTHGAVMHFESRDALTAYQEHPEHKRIVEVLNRLAPERLVVDYEVQPNA